MPDKYDIAKEVFDKHIAPIELPIGFAKTLKPDYVYKSRAQVLTDKSAMCTEQVDYAEHIFAQYGLTVDKYQLFAVPKNNRNQVRIDLLHTFIGIPNDQDWILFEPGFRARNRGGVKRFSDKNSGLQYIINLYKKTLIVDGISGLEIDLYKYDFPAENKTFSIFSNQILTQAKQIQLETTL
jgi:hypothetical protein